ncbi:MAG TPA: T9SS type A sorting domain-containing protein, partial [Puia sp.]|nr:T9SS type A sorting domain-containing protein [Puia sp.]
YSIQLTSDFGFVVAGYTLSNDSQVTGNHGGYDYWVVKLDSLGNLEWQKCLGGTGSDEPYAVQQTADNGYIVAGFSDSEDGNVSGNHGSSDYWIVKLTDDIATETPPLAKSTVSIFPNPVQSVLYVNFNGLSGNEIVHIYDLQGRMVVLPITFLNGQIQLNTTGLPGGFYTIQIFNSKTGKNVISKFVKGN